MTPAPDFQGFPLQALSKSRIQESCKRYSALVGRAQNSENSEGTSQIYIPHSYQKNCEFYN
jgi:hypothetical protein